MSILEKIVILVQFLLPQHPLSRLMGRFTHCRNRVFKNLFIRAIVKAFGVNLQEAAEPDPDTYACFNEFFTRPLRPGIRPIATEPDAVACPADGTVSQCGRIADGLVLQAKGRHYSVVQLLGGDADRAAPFLGGGFATIYLSPKDYHRLHMPLAGTLREMVHVPGRLFSVNHTAADMVSELFARNERVAAIFDTEAGPMALVLVGAFFVASIETVWHGVVTPPTGRSVRVWNYAENPITLDRGAEMGRFNMGSTMIVLFGPGAVEWRETLAPGATTRVGEMTGRVSSRDIASAV